MRPARKLRLNSRIMNALVDYMEDSAIATSNQPETRNTFTDLDMVGALVSAIEPLNADPSDCATILTSPGKAFFIGRQSQTDA